MYQTCIKFRLHIELLHDLMRNECTAYDFYFIFFKFGDTTDGDRLQLNSQIMVVNIETYLFYTSSISSDKRMSNIKIHQFIVH